MALAAKHPCASPSCPALVEQGQARCPSHTKAKERERGSASSRGYGSRWQRYRLQYLAEHPLCVRCEAAGRTVAARVVDHVVPHKGNEDLMWNPENHQALCDFTSPWNCHGAKSLEDGSGGFGR